MRCGLRHLWLCISDCFFGHQSSATLTIVSPFIFSFVRTLFSMFDWPIVCSLKIYYDSSLTLLKKLAYMLIVYLKALVLLIVCMKQTVIYVIIYVETQWSEQYKQDQPSNPVLDLSDEPADQWILMSASTWATGNGSKKTILNATLNESWLNWITSVEHGCNLRNPYISFLVHNVP